MCACPPVCVSSLVCVRVLPEPRGPCEPADQRLVQPVIFASAFLAYVVTAPDKFRYFHVCRVWCAKHTHVRPPHMIAAPDERRENTNEANTLSSPTRHYFQGKALPLLPPLGPPPPLLLNHDSYAPHRCTLLLLSL